MAFGGFCPHNNQVVAGGLGDHRDQRAFASLSETDVEVINVSPLRDDMPDLINFEWVPARPSSDVALMLALAHYLEVNDRVDRDFIQRYTTGYDPFRAYLLGETDGCPKDIQWAAPICGLEPAKLEQLADKLSKSRRAMLTVSLSLQRQQHGEQAMWMTVVLAAMLGQIGLPGGELHWLGALTGSGSTAGKHHHFPGEVWIREAIRRVVLFPWPASPIRC